MSSAWRKSDGCDRQTGRLLWPPLLDSNRTARWKHVEQPPFWRDHQGRYVVRNCCEAVDVGVAGSGLKKGVGMLAPSEKNLELELAVLSLSDVTPNPIGQ